MAMEAGNVVLVAVLAVLNFPLSRAAFRKIFGSWENFRDAMHEAHRDDYNPFWNWTASGADRHNNFVAEAMLLLFMVFCAGVVWAECQVIWYLAGML